MSHAALIIHHTDTLTRLSSFSMFLLDVGVLAVETDVGVGCGGGGKRCCSCDAAIDDWCFSWSSSIVSPAPSDTRWSREFCIGYGCCSCACDGYDVCWISSGVSTGCHFSTGLMRFRRGRRCELLLLPLCSRCSTCSDMMSEWVWVCFLVVAIIRRKEELLVKVSLDIPRLILR